MAFFSFFSRKPQRQKPVRRHARLGFDTLEERATPAANSISGYVYQDVNNNGIFDSGEAPLANVSLTLKSNATGLVVGTTTSNAAGFYEFTYDNSVNTTPTSITKTVVFPETDTNYNLTKMVDQFDPSLGQLTSIDIIHDATITSSILVENTSKSSGTTISGTVSGTLNLVAPGVNDNLPLSQNAGSITVAAWDGATDYSGASGGNLGTKTANGSKTLTITGGDLAAWQGSGQVAIQEISNATSSATGGGNISAAITSSGRSTVTVRYNYIPTNLLQPGSYTIIETQPVGFLDGKDAKNNVPIPNSIGTDSITLDLSNTPLVNNNFGELVAAGVSGFVYVDANNNGLKESGEAPIANVSMTLTGTDDSGAPVSLTQLTDATGFYNFANLRPGTYTVTQTQPAGFIDGKETPGTVSQAVNGYVAGNTTTNDAISSIVLPASAASVSNNFGELQASSLSGYVYLDANNNGIKDVGEAPISGTTVTLTGFGSDGPVSQTATTDASGFYQFTNLKPGTYGIQEGNPGSQYLDGKDTIGSQGGTAGNDSFSAISLASGVAGVNNNFGELQPASLSGKVYVDDNKNGLLDVGEVGIQGVTITLTGNDGANAINRTTTTNAAGEYSFTGLVPGTYNITETQPTAYNDGADNIGSLGGNTGPDAFSAIVVAMGAAGVDYNFGEIQPEDGDVGIVKTANKASVSIGDTLTYTLTVTNYGPHVAKGLTVTDTLPAGAGYLSASGAGWTISQANGIITATLPQLAVGASTTITVQIRVPAVSATITNTVVVTTTTPDNNPNNNTSTVTTPLGVGPQAVNPLQQQVIGGNSGKDGFFADPALRAVQAQLTQNAGTISAIFQVLLNRLPTQDEATYYGVQMYSGGLTAAQLTQQILRGQIHRGLQADAAYKTLLGRAPSAAERSAAIASINAYGTTDVVERTILTSAEYLAQNPTSAGLIGNIYFTQTGQLPTQAQSTAGVQAMANSPLDAIIFSVQQSDNARRDTIRAAFREVLRRHASAGEVENWLASMKANNWNQDALYSALFATTDFQALARTTVR
jgi:uncharacterized repeat protein (TIGR01451 family)